MKKRQSFDLRESPQVIPKDRPLVYSGMASDMAGTSQEKWARLNEVLNRIQVERCDLQYDSSNQEFVGPSENSVLKSIYLLIQKV